MKKLASCPKHLFYQKMNDILCLIEKKKSVQAISKLKKLKKSYPDDESVYTFCAEALLEILKIDREQRDLKLLNYIFNKAEENFFDIDLCTSVLGILLLIKTQTEEKAIIEVANRMKNMDNDNLQHMLKDLPDNAHHKKLIRRFKDGTCGCR